jgi:glycosyltransferase involved in cell wall biosynthesis
MPRVLRILNRLIIGGPLLNAAYLTRYMSPEFETLLVVGEKETHEKEAGFFTEELGIQPMYIPEMGRSIHLRKDYLSYRRIKSIIRDFKPDIVHTHAAKPGAVGRLAAAGMKVPVIVHTYHGHVFHSYFSNIKTKFFLNIERYLAKKSDAIIAISNQQLKELSVDFTIAPAEKFKIIPLGLDLEIFQQETGAKRKKFRDEFGVQDDEVVITITGRLVPVKNHILFLEGIAYVLENTTKKIKAFIVGDGETRNALEEKARKLGISFSKEKNMQHLHPLVFTSWRHDMDVINAGSDIIALTSLNEGTPVSLIEAQAAGKPVVSTRVGGISDVVAEGETGLLSDCNDKEAFCRNLLNLAEDEELRSKLGNHSTDAIIKKFSYRRLVDDMARLYYELLEKKQHDVRKKK